MVVGGVSVVYVLCSPVHHAEHVRIQCALWCSSRVNILKYGDAAMSSKSSLNRSFDICVAFSLENSIVSTINRKLP